LRSLKLLEVLVNKYGSKILGAVRKGNASERLVSIFLSDGKSNIYSFNASMLKGSGTFFMISFPAI
jgi:hypothetical protein